VAEGCCYGDLVGRFNKDAAGLRALAKDAKDADKTEEEVPTRCPTCGGLVYLPCIYCHGMDEANSKGSSKNKSRNFMTTAEELRYLSIRAMKEEAREQRLVDIEATADETFTDDKEFNYDGP